MIAIKDNNKNNKLKCNEKTFGPKLTFDVNHKDVGLIQHTTNEPRYTLNDTQPILLESLIWDKVCSYVNNEHKRFEIFKQLCQCLSNNKIIRPTFKLESLQPLREQFSLYLSELISVISENIDQNGNCSEINQIDLFTKVYSTPEGGRQDFIVKLNSKYHKLLSSSRNILALKTPRCLSDFVDEGLINTGGFGFVHKMRHKLDCCFYAIKIVPFKYKNAKIFNKIIREAEVFANLSNHENIVNYKTSWIENYLEINSENESTVCFTFNDGNEKLFNDKKLKSDDFLFKIKELKEDEFSNSDSFFDLNKTPAQTKLKAISEVNEIKNKLNILNVDLSPSNSLNSSNSINSRNSFYTCQNSESPKIRAFLFIQMELCEKNLRTWLDERNKTIFEVKKSKCEFHIIDLVDKEKILQIFIQTVKGVQYLHCQNLIHRDLKPQNILFASNGIIKISDFGLTTINEALESELASSSTPNLETRTLGLGTGIYSSPEQKISTCYDQKVDIYTLGLILYELVYPFATDMERYKSFETLNKHRQLAFNYKDDIFSQLILDLTEPDPNLRPDASLLYQKLNLLQKKLETKTKKNLNQLLVENDQLRQIINTLEQENAMLKKKILN